MRFQYVFFDLPGGPMRRVGKHGPRMLRVELPTERDAVEVARLLAEKLARDGRSGRSYHRDRRARQTSRYRPGS